MNPDKLDLPGWFEAALARDYLGDEPWRWAAAFFVLVLAFLTLRLLRRTFTMRLRQVAEQTDTDLDDLAVDLIERTHSLFLFAVAAWLGSTLLQLTAPTERVLFRLLTVALFLQSGLWASRMLTFALHGYLVQQGEEETAGRRGLFTLFTFFGQLAIWSVVILVTLDNLGFNVTTLIAGLGIGGVAVALALQNVLGDTFAALSIVLDKPFQVGDFVIIGDFLGTVERIGIKTTRIRSLSGEQLVFGNDDLLTSRIRNYERMSERRVLFGFGVLYQTPPEMLERVPTMVGEIIESIDRTRLDRVHFKGFGDSSLDFEIVYYVLDSDYNLYMDIQQQINLALVRTFRDEGIDFAYPTRTLFLRNEEQAIEVELHSAGPHRVLTGDEQQP